MYNFRTYDKDFINDEEIFWLSWKGKNPDPVEIRNIIDKSLSKTRLEPIETAKLLQVEDPELLEEIFEAARKLKQEYTVIELYFLHFIYWK